MDTTFLLRAHLVSAIGADVFLVLAGLVASVYLWQDWRLRKKKVGRLSTVLPSINSLDDVGIRLLTAAFTLMTVGMLAGSLMARELWGRFWYLDPRQVWSVLVWTLFAAVLVARFLAGWRGRRASIISVIGVLFMLAGHQVLSAMTKTQHGETRYDG